MDEKTDWYEQRKQKQPEDKDTRVIRKVGIKDHGHLSLEDVGRESDNAFFKSIDTLHTLDDGPQVAIRTLFPIDFKFPHPYHLTDEEIIQKIEVIKNLMAKNNIYIDLDSRCPERLVYKYIFDNVLYYRIPMSRPSDMKYHFDGCDGHCSRCFQRSCCGLYDDH